MSVSQLHTLHHEETSLPVAHLAQPRSTLRRRLVIGDAVAAFATFVVALSTPGSKLAEVVANPTVLSVIWSALGLCVAVALTLTAMATQRCIYRGFKHRTIEITRIARVSLLAGIGAIVGGKLIGEAHASRFPGLVVVGAFVFLNLWRMIFSTWLANAHRTRRAHSSSDFGRRQR